MTFLLDTNLIAATAMVHKLAVATRNTTDYLPTGVDVVDPWTVGSRQPVGNRPVTQ